MDLKRYPLNSLRRHIGRTCGLVALVALLAGSVFGGSLVVASLVRGLDSLEARMGADVIVVPRTAKSTHNLEDVLVNGVPDSFYMDRAVVERIAALDGVEKVSPQYYLATVKAGCCTMPIQIIGIDPATDFTIQPWIDHSYTSDLGTGDVVVGCNISGAPGTPILFYGKECTIVGKLDETGTALDSAAFCNVDTIQMLIEGSIEQGIGVLDGNDPTQIVSTAQVKVNNDARVSDVTDDINLHMRDVWAVQSKAMTTGVADSMAGVARVVGVLVLVVWVLAVAVLAVAFMILGKQRTKEFGVLRVLGATSGAVMRIVVTESLVVSAIGAVVGVVLAGLVFVAFGGAVEAALGLPFLSPGVGAAGLYAALTLAMALIVGMASSSLSARRLSKVDPSQILRDE